MSLSCMSWSPYWSRCMQSFVMAAVCRWPRCSPSEGLPQGPHNLGGGALSARLTLPPSCSIHTGELAYSGAALIVQCWVLVLQGATLNTNLRQGSQVSAAGKVAGHDIPMLHSLERCLALLRGGSRLIPLECSSAAVQRCTAGSASWCAHSCWPVSKAMWRPACCFAQPLPLCCLLGALHTPPTLPVMFTLDNHTACLQLNSKKFLHVALPAALAVMLPWSANLQLPYALTTTSTAPVSFPAVAVSWAANHAVPTASICTHRPLHCSQRLLPKKVQQLDLPAASQCSPCTCSAHNPVELLLL